MSLSANYPAIRPSLLLDFVNAPVLSPRVTFTRASSATYFDQLGVLQSASNDVPRFDYDPSTLAARGLLIEEQRTNSIRNNTMQGAVAGTPGTLPTNWITQSVGGVALTEIVGTGTENGITYIDLRYTGTTSSTTAGGILTEATTQITAASGQTWASSFYVRLVGGSTAGITTIANSIIERDAGGVLVAQTSTTISPNAAALNTQRVSTTRTLNQATTAFVQQRVTLAPQSGAAIDITLRIGLPQLEQGAFATSVIPTTTAAATRSADVASITGANFSSWFNATEGTLFVEAATLELSSLSGAAPVVAISDNTANNTHRIFRQSDSQAVMQTLTGGVAQATFGFGANWTTSAFRKLIYAYRTNDFAGVLNAGAVQTDTGGTLPSVDRMYIAADAAGGNQLNGWIARIAYYPSRLTNAQLQALTAS